MQSIKSLLDNVMRRAPIREGVRAAVIIEAGRDIVDTSFPFEIASGIVPKSFKNETLVFGVKNSIAAQELRMRSNSILKSLNERFPNGLIRRIKVEFISSRQEEEDMLR